MFRSGGTPRSGRPFDSSHPEQSGLNARDREFAAEPSPKPRSFDRALFIVWALVCFGVTNAPGEDVDVTGTGSQAVVALWGFAYLVAMAGIWVERKTAIRFVRASKPLIVILLIAGLSTLWSDAPDVAARRSFALLGTTLVALGLVCRLGMKGFLETIGLLYIIAAAWAAALIILVPNSGITPEGAWKGFFENKNQLGLSMLLGMVMLACIGNGARRILGSFQIAALLLFMALVVGSRSATSLIVAVTLALIFPVALRSRARQSAKAAILGALALLAAALAAMMSGIGQDEVLGALGRDASLTGRTDIWQSVIDAIADRPVFGYGQGVFWSPQGPATLYFPGWFPGIAHSGFLDVALNTGILGELALVVFLVIAITRAAALFWRGRDRTSAWPLFATLCVILTNFTEVSLERINHLHWVVIVAAFLFSVDACQRRAVLERRSRNGELDPQITFRSPNPI